jgi:HD superfamily phosphohydrolase
MQVGLVTAAGAVLSFLANDYQAQRQREDKVREQDRLREDKVREQERLREDKVREQERLKREYQRDLIKATLGRTTEAYNNVKRARRVLLATTTAEGEHLAECYDRYMLEIIDAELEFETLLVEVEASPSIFRNTELKKFFESIENYLGELITEYEQRRYTFTGDPKQLAKELLPVLEAFLGRPQSESTFSKFSGPKREAVGILQHELARLAQAE